MTTKHYQQIAWILNKNLYDLFSDDIAKSRAAVFMLVSDFCEMFSDDNPNFDKNNFCKAVGDGKIYKL